MIRANTARSPVSAQCGILGVPRSTCYWMTGHPGTEHVDPTAGDVRAVRRDSRGRHGARKIKAVLERMGVIASGRRISNIMREQGMTGAYARRRSKCVLSSAGVPFYRGWLSGLPVNCLPGYRRLVSSGFGCFVIA